MEKIEPYALWLGHADDGRAFQSLFERGIQAVVQVAFEEPPIATPRELIYCRFPLLDGEGNPKPTIRAAVVTVVGLLTDRVPTLVCCGAGMSRTPVIAAAAISRMEGVSFEDSLQRVTAGRPADVAMPLIADVMSVLRSFGERL